MNDETLLEAFNVWEELSHDPSKREAYRARLKYILDEEGKLDDVKYKAIKERDEEIIRNCIKSNIPIETISEITGRSIEELNRIIKHIKLK